MRKGIKAAVLAMTTLCTVALVALICTMPVMPVAHAYVGSRPTVEQVKIFTCDYDPSCAENLESGVNEWLKKNGGSIRIVDRKFIMADRGCYAIAIFYEKLPEQPLGKKLPAEHP